MKWCFANQFKCGQLLRNFTRFLRCMDAMDTLGPNEVLETHLAPVLDQLKCIGAKKAGRSLSCFKWNIDAYWRYTFISCDMITARHATSNTHHSSNCCRSTGKKIRSILQRKHFNPFDPLVVWNHWTSYSVWPSVSSIWSSAMFKRLRKDMSRQAM